MPSISLFHGIVVLMYPEKNGKHHRPHVHAVCGGESAVISIPDGEILESSDGFPPKKLRAVQTWVDFRQEDLMANWALAEQGLRVHDIKPLD